MNITENASLLRLNTFHVDAKARYLVELSDVNDIRNFLRSELNEIQPKLVLGGGSNVLFSDNFTGCIIRPLIKGIEKVSEDKEYVMVRAGAGENWDDFVKYCVENGYGGIENLSFIPGTVGASPIQNIGAYGMEVRNTIQTVETLDIATGSVNDFTNEQCHFSYRDSIFKSTLKNKAIVTHVTFKLNKTHHFVLHYHELKKELDHFPYTNLMNIRNAVISIRSRKLPNPEILANAGSFFKNPVIERKHLDTFRKFYPNIPYFEDTDGRIKLSAAWLIEQCGLKGRRENKTGTYKKQPLVIVNYGGATGQEILNFAQKIHRCVMNHFAIRLEMEVNVISSHP